MEKATHNRNIISLFSFVIFFHFDVRLIPKKKEENIKKFTTRGESEDGEPYFYELKT